jgi:PAS domain S-box-containing protein
MYNSIENLRPEQILEKALVGILTFSSDGKIDFVNENFRKIGILYRFESASLVGSNIFDKKLFPGVSLENELLQLKEGLSFEKGVQNLRTTDNGMISLIIKGSPIFDNDRFSGGVLVVEDIKVLSDACETEFLRSSIVEKLIDTSKDFIIISDREGKIKFTAGNKISFLQFLPGELRNKTLEEAFDKKLPVEVYHNFTSAIEDGKSFDLTIRDNGNTYELRIEPLINKQAKVNLVCFLFKNISEKIKLENDIKKLKQYELIIENVNEAIFAINSDGIIKLWNATSEFLTGYTKSEAAGKFFGDLIGIFNTLEFSKLKEDLFQYKILEKELTLLKKNNNKETVEVTFILPESENDTILVGCKSLSEKYKLIQELKESEKKFRDIAEQTGIIVCTLNPEGKIKYFNPAFTNYLKFPEEVILNKDFISLVSPDYLHKQEFNLNSFIEKPYQIIQLPLVTNRGETINFKANIHPVFDNGIITGYNCYLIDNSEQKRSEKDLLIFKTLFEASIDGIAVEYKGRIILSNDPFAKTFGYSNAKEIIGREILDFVSTDDILKAAEYFQIKEEKKEAPNRFEFLGKKKDGSKFHTEISVSSFESDGKLYIVIGVRDITERKHAQQAIRESEEKHRSITENIDDFLYTFERGKIFFRPTFYTFSIEKITGFSQAEFINDPRLLFKIIHPDDFTAVKQHLKNILKSRVQNSGEFESRIINKHGNIVWVRNKINLTRNDNGEVLKIYGLVSDITLRKKTEEELRKTTENLMRVNETKDKFISIISHDLRTPFGSILGFTDLLLNDDELTAEERSQYLSFIREASGSMLSLVNSLLDWTRLQTGRIRFEPERIKAAGIISKSFSALSGTAFQKKINLKSVVNNDVTIYGDKNLISQVFSNLISNAIKFTREGGNILVSAHPTEGIRFTEFSVKDDGIGIQPEDQKKLFGVDTKFTTEGTAGERGSGIGLSLVKEIIEKHNGSIWVISEPGKGSDFRFTLPVGSDTILLVDDNKTDRILYSKILKHITPEHNIETASNGKEALEKILSSFPALVITDHLMPEMSGYKLIEELKRTDVDGKPPVIVLSGDIDRQAIQEYNQLGIEYVFQKPVNLSIFKQAVEKSLRQGLKNL